MLDEDLGPGTLEWGGVTYKPLLSNVESGGALSITDSVSPPLSGPPRHVHDDADETFVILTGACEFWLAGERFTRRAGEAAFIPRGTEHTFRATEDGPCRHLVIMTPGGFEGFFAEMAKGQFAIPADMDPIEESAARHSLRFTGPPI